ncbi:alpha/beta hydrolase [bacterium]|nr:alpha/beta hydrolase [bacterium]
MSLERGLVESDGFQLRYVIEGEGQPALVIGSAVYYPRTFSEQLRRHLRLVFVDHRGFAPGSTTTDTAAFSLDRLIEDVERVRQQLGLERMIVIGHSGHAFMALEYAKRYPEHVSHVVLIGAGPDYGEANSKAADRYFEDLVDAPRRAALERNLALLPAELEAAPERRFITFCIRLGARSWFDPDFDAAPLWEDVEVNMAMFDHVWGTVFRDIDITRGLETFDRPVFLGLGLYDFLVPPHYTWSPIRAKFKDLTVRLFAKSGHTPQLEEPEAFDTALLEWLARPSI